MKHLQNKKKKNFTPNNICQLRKFNNQIVTFDCYLIQNLFNSHIKIGFINDGVRNFMIVQRFSNKINDFAMHDKLFGGIAKVVGQKLFAWRQ